MARESQIAMLWPANKSDRISDYGAPILQLLYTLHAFIPKLVSLFSVGPTVSELPRTLRSLADSITQVGRHTQVWLQ